MPIKECTINMGILGKAYATLAIIGMQSKLCFDVSFGENNVEKMIDIKFCPFCGRKLKE